ncbi:MAG: hypothetical protein NWF05_06190 [Candidatus Bathyarchaeota archaeon]|nr:hypothetical protein [Candidatus Bathyarchaeota archaeon]
MLKQKVSMHEGYALIRRRKKCKGSFSLWAAAVSFLIVVSGLAGSSVCYASELEYLDSTAPQKVLTLLEAVVGLDMAKYRADLEFYSETPFLYYDVLPQEDVTYALESDESKLDVLCSFADGKLRSMHTYVTEGVPLTTFLPRSSYEMAKSFLEEYQVCSGASYYSSMISLLGEIEADKNVSKISGDIQLKATVTARSESFRWTYISNGVEAPSKCVVLSFENGFLDYFIDTWSLFSVGSLSLNISEEEAVEIAMTAAENYSWTLSMGSDAPVTVTEFNIVRVSEPKLSIGNYAVKNESRNQDPLTLYPSWRVKLYFDALYPGNVYGLDIGIWADTGQLHDIRALISSLGVYPDNEIPEFPVWIVPFLLASVAALIISKKLRS